MASYQRSVGGVPNVDYNAETKQRTVIISIIIPFFLVGCFNMPTNPAQITGSYTSGLHYMNYGCDQLAAELDSLARRENQLTIAQEQRIKTSVAQAFWSGIGQGDGVEAAELANVKGEKEAVRKAIDSKKCQQVISKAYK